MRQFELLCREQALPLTVQRRDILKTVLERSDHPTADQVHEAVKKQIPGLSRTTVYRVLETLVQLGAIRRLHHPGASARFDGRIDRHHHLVCKMCHKIVDVDCRAFNGLKLSPSKRCGFTVEDYSVHFIGMCEACRKEGAARA